MIRHVKKELETNHVMNQYQTIQEAVDNASSGDIIQISPGYYYEKLEIRTDGLTLKGDQAGKSVITYDDYARKPFDKEKEYGTFRSYTCLVMADNVTLENLTVENTAGDGRKVGQALALYAEGDRLSFINCRFVAYQDTIFTGPLPPSPNIPGSFVGPSENLDYRQVKMYFDHCYIIGDVDFIFGSALVLFNECELVTRNRQEDVNGFVTAPSTWEGEPYGYVFIKSDFKGEEGIDDGTVFFGRPWRAYGQVTLIECTYDTSIHKDHWDPWGKESNKETTRFKEYGCKRSDGSIDSIHNDAQFIQIEETLPKLDYLDPWHLERIRS